MTVHLSQRFEFSAPHTLHRPGQPDAEGSLRWHGHCYQVRVHLAGEPDPATGMLVDLGDLRRSLEAVRAQLHQTVLDEVPDMGPGTIENLSVWIWRRLADDWPALTRVDVGREAHGDMASYFG